MKHLTRILMIATSRKTRGGVTAVLKKYEESLLWSECECRWLETHRDGNIITKLYYSVVAFIQALFIIPYYDIIHVHTSRPPSALRKLPFLAYARLWNKKVIVHLHFFETHIVFSPRYRGLYGMLCRLAHKVVVLSQRAKQEYASDIIPAHKMQVIYNPVTTIINTQTKYHRKNHILFAGLLTPLKGYKDLIRAFATIAPKYPDWKLVLAGNGEIQEAAELAQKLNIASQVELPGWVSGEDKHQYFSEASIFCLPSYSEGFPMAVLDAWAYHLPVVTTPVGGLTDVLVDQENAMVFEIGNIDMLALKLSQLIENPEFRSTIANESSRLAQTQFDMTTIYNNLKRLYINVLNNQE